MRFVWWESWRYRVWRSRKHVRMVFGGVGSMESAFAWLGNIHGGGLGRKGHGDGGDRFACGTSHVESVEEIGECIAACKK